MQQFGSRGLDLAGFGVTVFFALSGFLITLLLIKEKEATASVSIRKFYIRRILRIWPLYFLYMVVALLVEYFLFGKGYSYGQIMYYVLFVPNIPFVIGGVVDLLAHYWSLGVEEQFYVFWPLLIKMFINRFLSFSIVFIVLFLFVKLILNLYYGGYSVPYTLLYVSRFDCMAIGGVGAYLYHHHSRIAGYFNTKLAQAFAWGIMGLIFINKFHFFSIIDHELVAFVTVILIMNQVSNQITLIKLENRLMNYLGKISFGIYVYHTLIIALVTYLFQKWDFSLYGLTATMAYVFLIATATLGTAHFSYYYLEAPFLRKKKRYAVVESRNRPVS